MSKKRMYGATMRMKSSAHRILGRMNSLIASGVRFSAFMFLGVLPLTVGAGTALAPSALAQRGPAQRIVQGKVTDKGDAGISGAVVYLKDDHSLAVKSFISETDGGYRFGQLSDGTDYELWAESNGKKSSTKTISSFDTKKSFQINLKIDTSK